MQCIILFLNIQCGLEEITWFCALDRWSGSDRWYYSCSGREVRSTVAFRNTLWLFFLLLAGRTIPFDILHKNRIRESKKS